MKQNISVDGFNIRIQGTEERVNELEERTIEITQSDQQKKIDWKKHTKHIEPQGTGLLNTKQRNKKTHSICVIKVQEARRKRQG